MYLKRRYEGSSLYSLPLLSYFYFHSLIIGTLLLLQIILGYFAYFYFNGTVFSFDVLQYFFFWFSVFGIVNLVYQIVIGNMSLTLLALLNILVVTLTYALYLYSMRYFREKPKIRDILAFIFLFPYWLMLMLVQAVNSTEWFFGRWRNWWNK
ncbi:MAG TPA: hypothetical protein ENG00_01400 [Candidatus Aenigmarchaeota archaeon]|nr:hypothetical protein [Candidatus Aenigmarchaeota archaeon]